MVWLMLLLVNNRSSREGVVSRIKRRFNWLLAGRKRGEWILITGNGRGGIHGIKDLEYLRSRWSGERSKVRPSDRLDWFSKQRMKNLLVWGEGFGCQVIVVFNGRRRLKKPSCL